MNPSTLFFSTLFIIILIGALSAHISVNMLNEYYDFKSGLDLKINKTALGHHLYAMAQ
jgi:1,4-dihydroxy-2-naphthoate octaprenyltransferase